MLPNLRINDVDQALLTFFAACYRSPSLMSLAFPINNSFPTPVFASRDATAGMPPCPLGVEARRRVALNTAKTDKQVLYSILRGSLHFWRSCYCCRFFVWFPSGFCSTVACCCAWWEDTTHCCVPLGTWFAITVCEHRRHESKKAQWRLVRTLAAMSM